MFKQNLNLSVLKSKQMILLPAELAPPKLFFLSDNSNIIIIVTWSKT